MCGRDSAEREREKTAINRDTPYDEAEAFSTVERTNFSISDHGKHRLQYPWQQKPVSPLAYSCCPSHTKSLLPNCRHRQHVQPPSPCT